MQSCWPFCSSIWQSRVIVVPIWGNIEAIYWSLLDVIPLVRAPAHQHKIQIKSTESQNHLIYLRYLVCWHSAFYSLWTYQAKHFLLEIHILPCEISLNPISEEISSSAAEWLSKWGDQGSVPNGIGYALLGQRLSSISFICTFFYFLQILLCQKPAKPCHN